MPRRLAFIVALLALAVLPFARTLAFELVWDDRALIEQNPVVSGAAGAGEAFTRDVFWGQPERIGASRFYRPGLLLYFRWLTALGGGPLVLHAGSLVLHGVVTLLLFHLLARQTGPIPAFLGAAFFAVHPLRVESVAWVAGAGDVLCAALLLLALTAHLVDLDRRRWWLRALSLTAFAAALLVKEAAALFPVLLAVDALARGWSDRRRAMLVFPYAALAAMFWIIRSRVLGPGGIPEWMLASGPELLVRYLAALAAPWPHRINAGYDPVPDVLHRRFVIPALILLAAGLAALPLVRRWGRPLLIPVAWLLLFLLPVCVMRATASLFAERYTYLPALGLSMLIAVGLETAGGRLAHQAPRAAPIAAAAALAALSALATVAVVRTGAWRDDRSLASERLAQRPDDAGAVLMLAAFTLNRGDAVAAEPLYRQVTVLRPANADGWYGRGVAAAMLGRPMEAKAHLERSLALRLSSSTLNVLANVSLSLGQPDEAMRLYRRSLEVGPGNRQARLNLGLLQARLGRCSEARASYGEVARTEGRIGDRLARQAAAELRRLDTQAAAGGCR